jgi:excisionase family DNA binding protein
VEQIAPTKYVMTSEAARIVGVSSETIRAWANSGKLPFVATGRGVRVFDRAVVERIAAERRKA